MKYLGLVAFCCGLAIATVSGGTQEESEYSIQQVKAILKLPAGARLSFHQKKLHRMGDRIAVALIKIYSREEIKDPVLVKLFLPRVQEAFAAPDWIEFETDREPKVTLLLLDQIWRETTDPDLRSEIDLVVKELEQHLKKE